MHQISDTHQTTPTYYEPERVSHAPEQHQLRVLIDNIATTRGLTIQMSLRLMMFVAAPSDEKRQSARDEYCLMAAQFHRNIELIFGEGAFEDQPMDRVAWIRQIASESPLRRTRILAVGLAIEKMQEHITRDSPLDHDEARRFYTDNWPIVRDEMTSLIWDLWADLDMQKLKAVASKEQLHKTLAVTLDEIRRISLTVRMIALNAAILASNSGENGVGFSVIAKEVKNLAEKIQSSANRADKVVVTLNDTPDK